LIRRRLVYFVQLAALLGIWATCGMTAVAASGEAFHHHVHNFSVDVWNKSSPDYALAHLHAKEMGYTLVSAGPAAGVSAQGLGYIKLHNAYYAPVRIDFENRLILYFDYYAGTGRESLIRPDRQVSKWYPIDQLDLRLLKVYGCTRKEVESLTLESFTFNTAKDYFFLDWIEGSRTNIVANLVSKLVVQKLIDASLESFGRGKDSALFFDDLAHRGQYCANAATGNAGSFQDWKAGQKYWIEQVVRQVRSAPGDKRLVFGNIWDPNDAGIGETYLKWYADGSLRLDHYYYEAGPQQNRTIEAKKAGEGVYQYVSPYGHLPAGLVSISTTYGYYGTRITRGQYAGYMQGKEGYFGSTLEVAGIAGKQGSWFGWYGSNNLDRRELLSEKEAGPLVHTNDLQLLRAIPGWDNLASVPLESRFFDGVQRVYASANSYFSPQVIHSRHYETGEMFAVFKSSMGRIRLRPGEMVASAWFANHYFGKTDESALACLKHSDETVTLICDHAVDRGLRISLTSVINGKRP